MATYDTFKDKVSSEKITLAHLHAKQYLYVFTPVSGNIYKRSIDNFVVELLLNGVSQTLASSSSITDGEFYFDIIAKELYIYSTDIDNDEFIATYRFFFSNAPISASWNLSDTSEQVYYEPRLNTTLPYSIKTDASRPTIAIVGKGAVRLENNDGYFNSFFNKLIWTNQDFMAYSWNRDIAYSEAKLIYKGFINKHSFDVNSINMTIDNDMKVIKETVSSTLLTIENKWTSQTAYVVDDVVWLEDTHKIYTCTTDNSDALFNRANWSAMSRADADSNGYKTGLTESTEDTYLNRIWGRVDGVKLTSVSAIKESYFYLTGTVSGVIASPNITGTNTKFLSEVSNGDVLTINSVEFDVIKVISDTSLVLSENLGSNITNTEITNTFDIYPTVFNRLYQVSKYPLRETVVNIANKPSTVSFEVDSVSDLEIGDKVEVKIGSTYSSRVITNIAALRISLDQAVSGTPTAGDTITRLPVQAVFYNRREIPQNRNNYTVQNSSNGCFVLLSEDVEKNAFNQVLIDTAGSWTMNSGTNVITRSTPNEALQESIKPRDYIKISNSDELQVSSIFTDATNTIIYTTENTSSTFSGISGLKHRRITTIEDESNISANIIGETEDSTTSGAWIKNGSQFVKQQLVELGLSSKINTASFEEVADSNAETISIIAPSAPNTKTMPTIKSLVDDISNSFNGILYINDNFEFTYKIIDFSIDFSTDITTINESDIIKWSNKVEANQLYKTVEFSYNTKQINHLTEVSSTSVYSKTSDFANNVLGISETLSKNSIFFNVLGARAAAQRRMIISESFNNGIQITTNLKYINLQLLDVVRINVQNGINIGDITTNEKLMSVTSIKKDGLSCVITLTDIGSVYAKRAIISPNDTIDYTSATNSDRLLYSWITDDRGLLENNEDTKGRNIII